jgi:hypothetical protein
MIKSCVHILDFGFWMLDIGLSVASCQWSVATDNCPAFFLFASNTS